MALGLSNWALDPATMSRALRVVREPPGEAELVATAELALDRPHRKVGLPELAKGCRAGPAVKRRGNTGAYRFYPRLAPNRFEHFFLIYSKKETEKE